MPLLMLKDPPRYECLLECAKCFPDLDPDAATIFMQLLRTADDLFEVKADFMRQHNISNGRFTVLMLLMPVGEDATEDSRCEALSRSPAELADMAGVTRATMTGLIDTLEKDDLVRREPDPRDRRAMLVHLTKAGEAFMGKILPQYFRRVAGIMEPLSGPQKQQLNQLLTKVRGGIARAGEVEKPSRPAV